MRTHISLHTTDLHNSLRFYATLLDVAPTKVYEDYALFVTDQPGLELALNVSRNVSSAKDAHYGIAVTSSEAVDAAIERFRIAGLHVDVEVEETCCYAKQTKAWVRDPDGRRWETYVVLEEVAPEEMGAFCASAGCCG